MIYVRMRCLNCKTELMTYDCDDEVEFDETNTNYIGQYFFDIEMKKPNGKTRTISEGYFIFTQDITK